MAGHNKWSKVKRQKAVTDIRRSKIWAVITRDIMVAAREGGKDPQMNSRLFLAIQKAKSKNMPKDNIERAIKRGVGEIGGQDYKECTYEGYTAQGVAVIVDALTDNTNRTVAEVRSVFSKSGGSMAKSGSVAYLFERKGFIQISSEAVDELELLELVADVGAEEVENDDGTYAVITPVEAFEIVQSTISKVGIKIDDSRLVRIPTATVQKTSEQIRQIKALVEKLDDLQDVQEVFTNLDT